MIIAGGVKTAMAEDSSADIQALKKQITEMQVKVADLEAKKAPAAPAQAAPANIAFHGYLRGRIHTSEADGSTWEATEFAFQPRWDASDKIHGEVHIWYWPTAAVGGAGLTYTEAAFMEFNDVGIGKGSKLLLGKDRSWCYGITPSGKNRLTSTYSLYSAAINQARVVGLQSLNKLDNGKIDLNVGILNGYAIGTRLAGTASYTGSPQLGTNGTSILSTKDAGYDTNNNQGLSFRLAGKVTPSLTLGANFYAAKISMTELGMMNGLTLDAANTKKTHEMAGVDFAYTDGTFIFQGEYTDGRIASLDFDAFQILLGHNFDADNSVYVEYGQVNIDRDYDLDTAAALVKSSTQMWDKQQVVLSYKHMLSKKAWLQIEHEFNMEDQPVDGADWSAKTDNDITYLEFMTVY
jgi:hypothetical protein